MVLCFLAAGCGGRDEAPGPHPTGGRATAATTSTTAAPATTTTVGPPAPAPRRVLIVGDSVAYDAAPALAAAFRAGGVAVDAEPVLGLGLTRPEVYDWRAAWARAVVRRNPDLAVVLVGAWDIPLGPTEPAGWETAYERLVGEAVSILSARGARVVWIRFPPIRDPQGDARLRRLSDAAAAATLAAGGWVVDPRRVVGGPGGTFAAALPGPSGAPLQARKPDGVHFCPWGAALLARAVVDEVAAHTTWPAPQGWELGAWWRDVRYSPSAGCAPA